MPKIRTSKTKYPEDWEVVRPKLDEFEQEMREGNRIVFVHFVVLIVCFLVLLKM